MPLDGTVFGTTNRITGQTIYLYHPQIWRRYWLVVAIIGLLSFPVGTLINGYILFKWFRPETRAWFGV